MKKIEIYEENGEIVLCEYANMNSKTPYSVKYDDEVRNYLRNKLKYYKLKESYNNNTVIEFRNQFEEYDKVVYFIESGAFKNDYVKPLTECLFNKTKKVKRENKHVGKKIIASLLITTTLITIATKKNKKNVIDDANNSPSVTIEDYDENSDVNNLNSLDTTEEKEIDYSEQTTVDNPSFNIRIDYSDVTPDFEKLEYVKENYGELISECAKTYGIDPNIMIAIATQERGVHSPYMDSGGATGLMQIQNSVWIGEDLTAFNYDLDEKETITVTDELISSLKGNIKVGCMVFSYCLGRMQGNVLAAIQCYNMGEGNMFRNVLDSYSYVCGKSCDEILSDPSDIGWLKFRNNVNQGDRHYLERILSYMGDDINIQSLNSDLSINSISKVR